MTFWGWFLCGYLYFAGVGALAMYLAKHEQLKEHSALSLFASFFFIFTVPAFVVRALWEIFSNERKK